MQDFTACSKCDRDIISTKVYHDVIGLLFKDCDNVVMDISYRSTSKVDHFFLVLLSLLLSISVINEPRMIAKVPVDQGRFISLWMFIYSLSSLFGALLDTFLNFAGS